MARQKAPCGTYSAYKRHKSAGEFVDAACERARDERTAANAEARRAKRSQAPTVSFLASTVEIEDESDWDDGDLIARIQAERSRHDYSDVEPKTREEQLRWNLDMVVTAMSVVVQAEPAKLAPLSKRHSELLDELRRLDGEQPVKDAFDEFLGGGGGNVVGISTAPSRKQA